LVVWCAASPALAFHRDLPAVTAITTTGDVDLPRVPPQGRKVMALARDTTSGGHEIVRFLPFTAFSAGMPVAPSGSAPAVSYGGRTVAFETEADPLASGLPGSQIVLEERGKLLPGYPDPSGTSHKPSLDKRGSKLVFESDGDLTSAGGVGIRRVYLYDRRTRFLQLASSGTGWSGDAMIAAKGGVLVFASTSDPVTGADTGVSQIWVGNISRLPATRVTAGAGPSTEPLVSDDGRVVSFTSTADLAGDGHDTGVPQVFIYELRSQTFARLTNEPSGCTRPAVSRVGSDWRVAFVCDGRAYLHMLRTNQRSHVLTAGGVVQSIVPEMGVHFVMLSTTANLLGGGAPFAGHHIFLRNLFAAAAEPAAGSATWFPFQGIPSL
jgi:hypothetical protein